MNDQESTGHEIEGRDDTRTQGWDTYPLESVFVRTEQRAVVDVVRRINAGRYDLNPEYYVSTSFKCYPL